MRTVTLITLLLTMLLMLAGCGTVSMIRQTMRPSWLYQSPEGTQLLLSTCDGLSSDACSKLVEIELTENSRDREAWYHEVRVPVKSAIGIPYGRMPVDWYVVGPREACETFRVKVEQRKLPTEPCRGPVYFHLKQSAKTP